MISAKQRFCDKVVRVVFMDLNEKIVCFFQVSYFSLFKKNLKNIP